MIAGRSVGFVPLSAHIIVIIRASDGVAGKEKTQGLESVAFNRSMGLAQENATLRAKSRPGVLRM